MKKLAWYDLIFINLFWLGLNIRNNAVGAIFMPYLVANFTAEDLRNSSLGIMRTAGLVIAMLAQPAFGLLSDRSTSRFGRRRPFLVMGVFLDVVLLAWIAAAGSYWSLLAAVLFFQISSNISHGALQGLIPDLVPEDQRGAASAVKAIFELLPVVLLGVTIAVLVAAGQFIWAVIATAVSLVIILLVTLLTVHENPQREKVDIPLLPDLLRVLGMLAGILAGAGAGLIAGGVVGLLVSLPLMRLYGAGAALRQGVAVGGVTAMLVAVLGGVWAGVRITLGSASQSSPRSIRTFRWWVANRLMFLAAITSIQGFAPFFLMYAFQVNIETATGITGQLMTVVGICTLLSALPSGWLADRLGGKRLVAVSGLLATLGTLVLLWTVWLPDLALIYFSGVILGVATGLFVTVNWALGTRLIPPAEAGRYLGVSNLAGAGAGMIGSGIGGPLADYLNASLPGLGYFTIFAGYALLFLFSAACLRGVEDAAVLPAFAA